MVEMLTHGCIQEAKAAINYSSSAHDDYLITPQFQVQSGVSDQLTIEARNQSTFYPESFDVLVSTTGTAPADFSNALATGVVPPTSNQAYTYDLSAYAGQNVYVAFYSSTTDQYILWMDNFLIDALPSCQDVTALSATATSETSVEVTFTDPNATAAANGYIVTYDDGMCTNNFTKSNIFSSCYIWTYR